MTEENLTVLKWEHAPLPVTTEQLDLGQALKISFSRWMNATPQERAAWATEAEQRRAEERAAAEPVPLTLDALLDKMGWPRAYAEHLVQPYCECGDDIDGWSYCEHARDLGLAP